MSTVIAPLRSFLGTSYEKKSAEELALVLDRMIAVVRAAQRYSNKCPLSVPEYLEEALAALEDVLP